ncbi:Transmembrane protein 235 [Dissostichus eleginoides]|uniref:Transmembrane protein 235 n=1 Tax=Dissostichus eleginoides TaxID=100907 RepID=A0AAD9BGT8_DISEL|nr:Transmembrane protein 235 [Dissostichus eleginoides]
MKVTLGSLVITAGISGLLSFAFLATSLGTQYWYIIEMNPMNVSDFEDMSSHSGLWSINEGEKNVDSIDSFTADESRYSETELHMLSMHGAIVVVLPISLVLLLFGAICGLVSSLARSPLLLTGTAAYFFICSELWRRRRGWWGAEGLAHVHTSFGWSLGLAWLSYGLELLTGVLLLLAARTAKQQCRSPIA